MSEIEMLGMIGVNRERDSSRGVTVSLFGGGINPADEIPSGIDPDYITEFSLAHEASGFDKVLIGYSSATAEGFGVAGYAASQTKTLGYLIAHRPGFVAPTLAARQAATLDQLTGGRIALHIISGGSDVEQRRDGDWIDHDARYRRSDEFMDVLRRVWTETSPFDYEGEFYRFEQNLSEVRTHQKPHVPLYFGGASDVAKEVGAKRADVYALWGEPLESIRRQIGDIRQRAARYNRDIRFSVSVRPILGDTEGEAWERARGILDRVKSSVGSTIGPGKPARLQSEGSRRLLEFAAKGDVHDKRLWMPIAATTGAAGSTTCLVGTAEQVADSLLAYHQAGASAFIIRGFDPLQDTIDWGKELIPRVREAAALART
ncbi:MAG: LLM class flavin-dependent oxidoreductase [Chloroflexota bacterium]|jgi:alkanesulfonate monooxygenase|nr:LLM class flavin-dependent oxidoreductase [Dehalococcoidia bacterium]MEC8911532.1 LLM class flavin-dependent oxidoreductase [Chloroflexota bacterium]|tara:strand:+ start:1273 stop:2394 length:1122 start_codon:yes stop_codon:yes gene_type:complete